MYFLLLELLSLNTMLCDNTERTKRNLQEDFVKLKPVLFTVLQAPVLSDDQPSLETVTSVDQLLQLLYPEYSLLQHCLRKKQRHSSSLSSLPSFSTSLANPLTHANNEDLWGQPREEALYRVDGTLGGKH